MPAASARLLRAADAERDALARNREALERRREQLRAELDDVEAELAALEERADLLDRLAPRGAAAARSPRNPAAASRSAHDAGAAGAEIRALRPALRGTAVRVEAVRTLLASGRAHEPIHYRDWYAELTRRGHLVAGRDPLAVFLTQLGRSPLVRRTTAPGTYVLDRETPHRLRRELATLHAELRSLVASPEQRARREQLVGAIGRTERALDEVQRSLVA